MERMSISFPSPVLKKLRKYASKQDMSVSSVAVKLIELGLVIEEKNDGDSKNKQSNNMDVSQLNEEYLSKVTIQTSEIVKVIAKEVFKVKEDVISKIIDSTQDIYDKNIKKNE